MLLANEKVEGEDERGRSGVSPSGIIKPQPAL